MLTYILSDMNIFKLDVVDSVSETQLQLDEYAN